MLLASRVTHSRVYWSTTVNTRMQPYFGGHEAGDQAREFQVNATPTLLQTSPHKLSHTNLHRWTWALENY